MKHHLLLSSAVLLIGVVACDQRRIPVGVDQGLRDVTRVEGSKPADIIVWRENAVTCMEIWGGGWGCEYDNSTGGSPWTNPIRNYCALYPETCTFVPTGGGSVANPVFPLGPSVPDDDSSIDSLPVPCASNPDSAYATRRSARAWCKGTDLASNLVAKARVQLALLRMRAKGGTCAALANLGDSLVAASRIRVFPHGAVDTTTTMAFTIGVAGMVGGSAIHNGGVRGPFSFFTISDRLTRFAWDSEHRDMESGVSLDNIVAHELSHLLGDWHISPQTTPIPTTSMEVQCS